MQAATGNVAIGAQVWVEDPELAWAEGEVLEINDKKAKVRTVKGNEVNGRSLQFCMEPVMMQLSGCGSFLDPSFVRHPESWEPITRAWPAAKWRDRLSCGGCWREWESGWLRDPFIGVSHCWTALACCMPCGSPWCEAGSVT